MYLFIYVQTWNQKVKIVLSEEQVETPQVWEAKCKLLLKQWGYVYFVTKQDNEESVLYL